MTPLFSIFVLFISSILLIRLLNKRSRDESLSRTEKVLTYISAIIAIVWGFLVILTEYVMPNLQFLPLSMTLLILFLLVSIVVISVVFWKRDRGSLDPRFKRLHIYYSDDLDRPDSKELHRPYYVVNEDTRQAYYVPELIMDAMKKSKIAWNTYHSKNVLLAYFKKQGVTPHDIQPSEWELGLYQRPNGSIMYLYFVLDPETFKKLKECGDAGKLKNYKLVFLNPRWCWPLIRVPYIGRKINTWIWPPSNVILANISTKEAFQAPKTSVELAIRDILSFDGFTLGFENIAGWCKKVKGWNYDADRCFTEEQLLESCQ